MPERSAAGRITAELEAELARLDRDQLQRLCAHLIRTYVIEPRPAGITGVAPAEPKAAAAPPAGPPAAVTPPPRPDPPPAATQEQKPGADADTPAPDANGRFNKLEMD
jgi:hypothetical protein